MGMSLKQRFNGNSQEVLEYARQFGIWKAMEQYEVKDYVAMLNFLQAMAPGETFNEGHSDYDAFATPKAFDYMVEATQRYIAKLEVKIQQRDEEIARLKSENENFKKTTWNSRKSLIENFQNQITKHSIDFA